MVGETHVLDGLLQFLCDQLMPLALLQASLGLRSPLGRPLSRQSHLSRRLCLRLGFRQSLGFAPSTQHPLALSYPLLVGLLYRGRSLDLDRPPAARLLGHRGGPWCRLRCLGGCGVGEFRLRVQVLGVLLKLNAERGEGPGGGEEGLVLRKMLMNHFWDGLRLYLGFLFLRFHLLNLCILPSLHSCLNNKQQKPQ